MNYSLLTLNGYIQISNPKYDVTHFYSNVAYIYYKIIKNRNCIKHILILRNTVMTYDINVN